MKPSSHDKRWTPAENEKVRLGWGDLTVEKLAAEMGRTPIAIYDRGRKLGLTCGVPQGYSYLTTEADRVGFGTGEIRKMLRAAHLPIRKAMARPRPGVVPAYTFHVVLPDDVDFVVAKWSASEVVNVAARARRINGEVLRRLLVKAGHIQPMGVKHRWRVPTLAIDEVVAQYRALFSVARLARRFRVSRCVLAARLRAAGVLGEKQPGVEVKLPVEVVQVVMKAFRKKRKRTKR